MISIGTLAVHPLWGEQAGEARTGHATTTLVSSGRAHVLVDPSLPPAALLARLAERTPLRPDQITHVFLTAAGAEHRRALAAFPGAEWLAGADELAAARAEAAARIERAGAGDAGLAARLAEDVGQLARCRAAPDRIAPGIDLFPLPGVTPGTCGLLLSLPQVTVLICGDAVATREHLEQGKVLPGCHDVDLARESFAEAVQIADVLVPGRDNLTVNPLRQRF